ncbi:MAG TPA: hypothetical protein GX393_06655 [Firmicutes bacterium]|nr:hypothetical protein [Bacillota bacterium]
MRVLIMHADDPKTKKSVAVMEEELKRQQVQIDLISPASAGTAPVSTAPYGLVCIVCGYKGWWKPQIPVEMDNLIKRTTRMEGKRGCAFIVPGLLGVAKALRVLMGHMERQGVIVEDFGALGGRQEIVSVVKRLKRLL